MTLKLSDFAARLRQMIQSGFVPGEFGALALESFDLQFAHNPAYRRLCEARGVSPDTITDWLEIPAVPTSAFKELELSCLPAASRTTVFHSSGTTEHRPSRHFHNAESLVLYDTSLWPSFKRHVMPESGSLICDLRLLTPPPAQSPHSSLVHMFEVVRRKFDGSESAFLGCTGEDNAWKLNLDAVLDAIANTQRPTLLLGTAFSFVHLLDSLEERGLSWSLPAGSRAMETGGYKGRSRSLLKAELHALITGRLGVASENVICEYGMSELSSQAYDTVAPGAGIGARVFRFPPWARAQIISPETGREVTEGETGLIRVYDLANAFSVMAVQTEDLGVRRGEGFELLGRAVAVEPRGCSLMAVA